MAIKPKRDYVKNLSVALSAVVEDSIRDNAKEIGTILIASLCKEMMETVEKELPEAVSKELFHLVKPMIYETALSEARKQVMSMYDNLRSATEQYLNEKIEKHIGKRVTEGLSYCVHDWKSEIDRAIKVALDEKYAEGAGEKDN